MSRETGQGPLRIGFYFLIPWTTSSLRFCSHSTGPQGDQLPPTMRFRRLTPGYFRVLQVSTFKYQLSTLTYSSPTPPLAGQIPPNSLAVTFPAA